MHTTRVKTHVFESRQVTPTMAADFPPGDVELEVVVRHPPPPSPYPPETDREFEVFLERIRAFRDEVNRETKSGPYAEE